MNLRVLGISVFVVAMALPAACSSSSDAAPPSQPPPSSPLESSGPSGLSDPSGLSAPVSTSVSTPPTAGAQPSAAPIGRMPDVVGERLSEAEAALTAAGFMSVNTVDGTGRGRTILKKDNWVVQRQNPGAGTTVTDGTTVTLAAVKPTDDQPVPRVDKGVVPRVVCLDLQDAQDAMRGAGFYLLIAKDGLGEHRYPLIDRDWVVVGQSAAVGSSPAKTTRIELTVVKFGEPTGNSGCES